MSAVERWAPWWALIVVPLAFLGNQSAAYAIVAFACRSQRHVLVHVFPALTLVAALLGVALCGWCMKSGSTRSMRHRSLSNRPYTFEKRNTR